MRRFAPAGDGPPREGGEGPGAEDDADDGGRRRGALLYTGRGLSAEEIVRILVTTAERTLCRAPGAS